MQTIFQADHGVRLLRRRHLRGSKRSVSAIAVAAYFTAVSAGAQTAPVDDISADLAAQRAELAQQAELLQQQAEQLDAQMQRLDALERELEAALANVPKEPSPTTLGPTAAAQPTTTVPSLAVAAPAAIAVADVDPDIQPEFDLAGFDVLDAMPYAALGRNPLEDDGFIKSVPLFGSNFRFSFGGYFKPIFPK